MLRRWLYRFVALLLVSCAVIVCFNYLVDPLWCFNHTNRYNSQQLGFDERQQKSDFLAYRQGDYDALLLGSSRVVVLNQADVAGYKAFNFAVNAMMPDEYAAYVRYARRHSNSKLKLVLLGLDFFGSNENFKGYGHQQPDFYFRNAESPFYRFQTLLTLDELNYTSRNIRQLFHPLKHSYYNRENINIVRPLSERFRELERKKNLQEFDRYLYGKTYRFRDIKPHLIRLRDENPDIRFIVFTTPESLPVWRYLEGAGRVDDYLRWIGDIVAVFGAVHNFMGENDLTSNLGNFQDAHHLMSDEGSKLLDCLLRKTDGNAVCAAGTVITRENYPSFAAGVRINAGNKTH